ncbi:MAG: hypothetical protein WC477_03205 [Patescibacteria group bacterium]
MQLRWNVIVAAIVVLGASMWLILFFVAQTPKELVANSVTALAAAKGLSVRGSVYWDNASPTGQGYIFGDWISFQGVLDAHEPGLFRVRGVAGFDATSDPNNFQTADIVADAKSVSFHARTVTEPIAAYLAPPAGSATGTWVAYQRDELVRRGGLDWLTASGTAEGIFSALKTSDPTTWFRVISSVRKNQNGRETLIAKIAPNTDAVAHAMFLFMSAWQGKNLTTTELASAEQVARGMELGEWTVTIDAFTSRITSIQAMWPTVDHQGHIQKHIILNLSIDSLGYSGPAIQVDPSAKDVTDRIRPAVNAGFGQAANRATSTETHAITTPME